MSFFSPNVAILVITLLIAGSSAAIFFNRQNSSNITSSPQPTETKRLPSQTAFPSSPNPTPAASVIKKTPVVPSETKLTTPTPTSSPAALLNYIYPQAKVTFQTSSKLELESNADPTAITDWYKNKIRGLGFSAKSFAQTNTNGAVFNKLSAARTGEKIEITIKKDQNASNVTITVDSP